MRQVRKSDRGFTLLEILIVFTIIAFTLPSLYMLMESFDKLRQAKETQTKVKMIAEVIKKNFWENLNFARRNCYGWTDPSCSTISLTPEPIDNTTIRINAIDPATLQVLVTYGCLVTSLGGNSFSVQCYDGYGQLFQFAIQNQHARGAEYYLPYQNRMFQLTITPSLGNAYVIDLNNELNWAMARTDMVLSDIADAVRGFVRRHRQLELGNSCGTTNTATNPTGGLGSWDDALAPWVWKSVSQNATALCSGIEDAQNCGCSNHTFIQNWETNNQFCRVDTTNEWQRFLGALGLGIEYRDDGLGNALTFVPLADANGNPVNCPPPRPGPNYNLTGLIPKSRIGVYDAFLGTWYRYFEVVSE